MGLESGRVIWNQNKKTIQFRERENDLGLERERLRCGRGGSASPSSTNNEQIYLSLLRFLIMEASVLGGQHGSKKTMGNTTCPPCLCCETQIGSSGCGFPFSPFTATSHHQGSLLDLSFYLFFSWTHPLGASFFDP